MKYLTIILSIFMFSCISVDSEKINDIIDNMAETTDTTESGVDEAPENDSKDKKDKKDKSDETSDEIYRHENGIDYHSGTGDALSDGTAPFVERSFVATYSKTYTPNICPNFPSVLRLYSYDNFVDIENNQGGLLTTAKIFEDGTIDFWGVYNDSWGRPSIDLFCTCENNAQFYGSDLECVCEIGDSSCRLNYNVMN